MPRLQPCHWTPPLFSHIRIAAGFRRSINLERDQDAADLLRGYVPTSRALAALEQLADGLEGNATGRALALIGPYGAGKSAFALFAGALLGAPDAAGKAIADAKLRAAAPGLAKRLNRANRGTRGLLRVQVNGIPDSLIRQLMLALARAAEQAALPQPLVKRIQAAARPGTRMDHVIDLITQTRSAWENTGGGGLLIELDELGKLLEFEAQGGGRSEQLLQLLARGSAPPKKKHPRVCCSLCRGKPAALCDSYWFRVVGSKLLPAWTGAPAFRENRPQHRNKHTVTGSGIYSDGAPS
jgi:hypothetical protein